MVKIAPGWTLDVDRGPDWIIVRVHPPHDEVPEDVPPLADSVWALAQQNRVTRVVLELDEVPLLYSRLIGQLILLYKRIGTRGGLLRICGLSEQNQEILHTTRLDEGLPPYLNRGAAVRGDRPLQPR